MKGILTYYTLLEVDSNATNEEILKAYKALAKIHHPDKNDDNASSNELFKMLNLAKETLLDEQKRLEYDYLIGVKQKPQDPPKNAGATRAQTAAPKTNWAPAIGLGLVGLIVGIAIGAGEKEKGGRKSGKI